MVGKNFVVLGGSGPGPEASASLASQVIWPCRKVGEIFFRSVSGTGTRPDPHRSSIPAVAVAMIGWHVARHWPAGDGGKASVVKMASTFKRLVLWRYRFSFFWN